MFEPFPTGFVHIPPPFCYRCPFNLEYDDCGIVCAEILDEVIVGEGAETVAAFIAEPIIAAGDGFVCPPPEYFKIIREICDRHGVVMIMDEIITGFGRMGRMFGSELLEVWPDILVMGKGMSGGYYPVAATMITDEIAGAFWGDAEVLVQFHAGHTFSGLPLAGAAGVAAIREIMERYFGGERGSRRRTDEAETGGAGGQARGRGAGNR